MSLYIGDNADCLTRGRLSSVCLVPGLCLAYVWPAHVCLDCYLIVIKLRFPMLAHRVWSCA